MVQALLSFLLQSDVVSQQLSALVEEEHPTETGDVVVPEPPPICPRIRRTVNYRRRLIFQCVRIVPPVGAWNFAPTVIPTRGIQEPSHFPLVGSWGKLSSNHLLKPLDVSRRLADLPYRHPQQPNCRAHCESPRHPVLHIRWSSPMPDGPSVRLGRWRHDLQNTRLPTIRPPHTSPRRLPTIAPAMPHSLRLNQRSYSS
jgi:hypothetical protein